MPTVLVVDGPAVSGPALLLGVADLVVMTEGSYAFVNGPMMVEEFTGVRVSTAELGGAGELARHTGVPSLVVPTARRPSLPSATCSPTCLTASTTSRPAGRATTRPTAPARKPAN